ncbi:MAG: hypothetical protein ACFBSD_07775 [Paracoccaceae bacterium]
MRKLARILGTIGGALLAAWAFAQIVWAPGGEATSDPGSPPFRTREAHEAGIRPPQPDPGIGTAERRALGAFPDLDSCLVTSAEGASALSPIDWNRVRRPADAEICLFRAFATLASAEAARDWLSAQGFQAQTYGWSDTVTTETADCVYLSARWPYETRGFLLRPRNLLARAMMNQNSVFSQFCREGQGQALSFVQVKTYGW